MNRSSQAITVAIDVGPLYGHRTGVGAATQGMFDALSERDDIVLDPFLVSSRSAPRTGHRKLPVPGIVASHLWARTSRPSADRWLDGVDLVHGTNYVAPPSRRPTVVSVYDCWFLRHPDLATPLVRRAGTRLRRLADGGAWIHTSSDATAEQARSLLDTDRVRTVYLGIPSVSSTPTSSTPAPSTPAPSTPTSSTPASDLSESLPATCGEAPFRDAPFLVCIGTEERRKGIPLMVEAFDHLAGERRDLHLVLAGARADDSAAIDTAIATVGSHTRRRIHRLGPIDEATKAWLLDRAATLVYPSLDEGFGFPVLEAQRYAVPVVATRVGSLPEVAGDGAEFVGERQPVAVAETVARVLDDDVRRRQLVAAGTRNLDRFCWETTAAELADLYAAAIDAA